MRPFIATALLLTTAALVGMPTNTAQAEPTLDADEQGSLILVLDSSGSMAEPATGGVTKISAAKSALRTVIDDLPDDIDVGLNVFGSEVQNRSQPGACTDTRSVVPVGPIDRPALRRAIRSYRPYGETPIGNALLKAAEGLPEEGPRRIVLLSDGEPTCAPDPCKVARQLHRDGIDLRIDVVGLAVDSATRDALACIADAGGGRYLDAGDTDTLVDALDTATTRAPRPFTVEGEPVEGSPTPSDAPLLAPGAYVDRLPVGQQAEYFRLTRSVPGTTLHVGATLRNRATVGTFYLRIRAGDTECGYSLGQEINIFGSATINSAAALASALPGADATDSCAKADTLLVSVESASDDLARAPYELVVIEEPPLESENGLRPAFETGGWSRPGALPRLGPLVGGQSLADATAAKAGVHRIQLVPGETQTFGVELDWGQRLQTSLVSDRLTGLLADRYDITTSLDLQVFGPNRGTAVDSMDEPRGIPQGKGNFDDDLVQVYSSTDEVRYLNRTNYGGVGSSLAGLYTVVVGMADSDGPRYAVTANLTVDVVGDPARPPAYAQDVVETPTVTPPTVTQPTVTPPTGGAEPEASSDSDPAGDGAFSTTVLVATAAAVSALLLVVALGLVHRRRRRE